MRDLEGVNEFEKTIELDPTNEEAKFHLKGFLVATGITPVIRAKSPNFS